MKKCTLCDNERYSSHWNCIYCAQCKEKIYLAHIKRGINKWKVKNKEHLRQYRTKNLWRWKDNRNKKNKKRIRELSDSYIRAVLAQHSPLKGSEFPEDLVRLKRLQLQLKREKESRNGKEASENK